jgi:cytidylate kinase
MKKLIKVALDGPGGAGLAPTSPRCTCSHFSLSASGKSSVAKVVAEKLGLLYVDSGSMYRAVTLHCMYASLYFRNTFWGSPPCDAWHRNRSSVMFSIRRQNVDFADSSALLAAAQSARVCLRPPSVVLLNDEDVSGLIR